MTRPRTEPAINLPPFTLSLIAVYVAVFAAIRFLPADAGWQAIDAFGFIPQRYIGGMPAGAAAIYTPITYQFLHGDWVHLAVNMVSLAAFALSGRVTGIAVAGCAVGLPAVASGVMVGRRLQRRLNPTRFRSLVLTLMSVAAFSAIVSAVAR
jgi:membrane associated rhomboid family serine protease